MICVYARQSSHAKAARTALEPRHTAELKDRWTPFRRTAPRSECAVVILPLLREDRFVGRLASFRHRFPHEPLVLVTRRQAANLRRTKDVRLDEIVWLNDMTGRLVDAVERARTDTFLRRQAQSFEESEHLPPKLQRALVLACRSEQPVRSVNGLAEAVACDRRTLWRQWRQTTSQLQFREFLAWLQLVQAVNEKMHGQSARAVARQLGISKKTLGPLARRLTDQTFGELSAGSMEDLLERFRKQMEGRVFDQIPDEDILG